MKLLSKWPLTHHLYSQCSPPLPPLPHPLSTFTRPCACSIYCNCIQHLALQTADKPAQGQPPTLVMLINRLFVRAYQSPYPPSLCGCLWTLCTEIAPLLLLLRGGWIRASSLQRERAIYTGRSIVVPLKMNNNDSQSLSLYNV